MSWNELLARLPVPTGVLSADGLWLEVSDSLGELFMRLPLALRGVPMAEALVADDRAAWAADWRALRSGKLSQLRVERQFLRADGSLGLGDFFVAPATPGSADGLWMVQIVDREPGRQARRQPRWSSRSMELAADSAELGFWEYDILTDQELWDDRMLRIYGILREDFAGTGSGWALYLHPDDLEQTVAAAKESWVSGASRTYREFRIIRPNGEIRHLRSTATITRDASGTPLRLAGISQDITAQKRIEDRLRRSEASLRHILDHLPFPVATHTPGPDSQILLLNRRFTETYGYTIHETPTIQAWARRAYPDAAYRKELLAWWDDAFERAVRSGGVADSREIRVVAKDGSVHEVIFSATLVEDTVVAALQDITQLKEVERALANAVQAEKSLREEAEEARSVAERATRAKSLFLANISHEIRTPLSALVALSSAMWLESEKHHLSGEFSMFLNRIRSGGDYLNLILTNLLDISAIESGHVALRPEVFYLADWAADVRNILEPIAQSRAMRLAWQLPDDEEIRFCTDVMRLTQILLNLAHNAVKFSGPDGGTVTIGIEFADSRLLVSVADEGPGVAPEKIDGLFREYEQNESHGVTYDRGVGLGLAVVKQNTNILGGTIQVSHIKPHGLQFVVELPAFPPPSH